jgi:hypothetical protein
MVGAPVVYACRLSGGPVGTTLLNHPAYEAVMIDGPAQIIVQERKLELKHEGSIVCYDVRSSRPSVPRPPPWHAMPDPGIE